MGECEGRAGWSLYHGVGARLCVPPAGFQYLGWAAVAGPSRADADARMRELLRTSRFEVCVCVCVCVRARARGVCAGGGLGDQD